MDNFRKIIMEGIDKTYNDSELLHIALADKIVISVNNMSTIKNLFPLYLEQEQEHEYEQQHKHELNQESDSDSKIHINKYEHNRSFIQRDRQWTWKIKFYKGQLILFWSICEALLNKGINAIEAFKLKTFFNTHKKSRSKRNGFKYFAIIDNWFCEDNSNKCILTLKPVMVNDIMMTYNIIIRNENCDVDQFNIAEQLTNYTNSISDEIKAMQLSISNNQFARTLFNKKTKKQ